MKRSLNVNKSVLNGFLSQAVSHNKLLEEAEMWKKKRELEEANEAEKDSKRHYVPCASSSRSADSPPSARPIATKAPEDIDDLKVLLALYKDVRQKPEEKWGHDGFEELYPDHKPARPASCSEEKSRHAKKKKKSSKKNKKKKKKKKHNE